jgi:hypothetical protein
MATGMDTSLDANATAASTNIATPAGEAMVDIEADEDITFHVPVSVLRLPASVAVLAPELAPPAAFV